jgi:hypothetical protein
MGYILATSGISRSWRYSFQIVTRIAVDITSLFLTF